MFFVIVDGKVFCSEEVSIVLGFSNDQQRATVAEHLQRMPPAEHPRLYASFPDNMDGEVIINEAKVLLDEKLEQMKPTSQG